MDREVKGGLQVGISKRREEKRREEKRREEKRREGGGGERRGEIECAAYNTEETG